MKNHELRMALGSCPMGSRVSVINPGIDGEDYASYGISRVTYLTGSYPADTIIEADGDYHPMAAEDLTAFIDRQDPDGDVQVYVEGWEGQNFAYFDIKELRLGTELNSITLGAWRCGG